MPEKGDVEAISNINCHNVIRKKVINENLRDDIIEKDGDSTIETSGGSEGDNTFSTPTYPRGPYKLV